MAGVVEEIFRIKSDTAQVLSQIQQLKGVFTELTEEQKKQVTQLAILEQKEKELLKARNASTNPTTQIRINKELNENIKQLGFLKEAVDKFAKSETVARVEADALAKSVSNAFKQTQVGGATKQIEQLGQQAAGATKSGFNPLNNSLNQLSRELPAFAVSANVGFLAISNNLPIFFDAIERTKKINAELQANGQKTTSVLSQLGSALFSMGSLLSIGVTLLTLYGGKLIEWVSTLTDGEKALKSMTEANDNYAKSMNDLGQKIADTTIKLKVQMGILTEMEGSIIKNENGRTQALKDSNIERIKRINALKEELGITSEILKNYGKTRSFVTQGGEQKTVSLNSVGDEKQAKKYFDELKRITDITKSRNVAINEYYNLQAKVLENENKSKINQRDLLDAYIKQKTIVDEIAKMRVNSIQDERIKSEELAKLNFDLANKEIDLANQVEKEKTDLENSNYEIKKSNAIANAKDKQQLNIDLQKLEKQHQNTLKQIAADNIPLTEQSELRTELRVKLLNELAAIEDKYRKIEEDKNIAQVQSTFKAREKIIIENDNYEIYLVEQKIKKLESQGDKADKDEIKRLKKLLYEKKLLLLKDQEEQEKANLKRNENGSVNAAELAEIENRYRHLRAKAEDEFNNSQEKKEKDSLSKRSQKYINYFQQLLSAAIDATNKIIDLKIKEVDAQISAQEKRVEAAKSIADRGNAELLELEQKRLDDLTKKREKYVRDQQGLAAVELVANTAIAVSKAAAQGGAAAGVTIAAAILALVAGLASAKAIASQAAYYDGGLYEEKGGYTGDGNPTEVSKAFRKPYTAHKAEVIISHKPTRKFKDILLDINDGKVDLNEWKKKVNMFDSFMDGNKFNTNNPYTSNKEVVNIIDFKHLEGKLDTLNESFRALRLGLNVDEDGFTTFIAKKIERRNFIEKQARA